MTESIFNIDEETSYTSNFIHLPNLSGYTIYGKSNCNRCDVLKEQMSDINECVQYVNCDEYLSTDKEKFKKIMFKYMNKEYKENENNIMYFPLVFYNGNIITNYYRFFQ